jgi:glutathione S-transferase
MERYHQIEALNFAATEIHKQLGALFNPQMTPEMKTVQIGTIERRFGPLEKMLEGKAYIMGDKFTAADAYLFTVLNWTNSLKIDLTKWPNIKAYVARIAERPKVREAMKVEGLIH